MGKPSVEDKTIAKAAATAFGGTPRVERHWDDSRSISVDILSCGDSPSPGVTSYATVGVSRVDLVKDGKKLGVHAELVGACGSGFGDFASCLSTAALHVIKSGWLVAPGIIFPDVVSTIRTGTMKHFLFLPPFVWDDRLKSIKAGEKEERHVAWLLAVPISHNEMLLAESKGVPALEDVFDERQIDIFDLDRASVV